MKATHGVFGGKSVPIYKDPKTDVGGLKKSQRGCCAVQKDIDGYHCFDGYNEWVEVGTCLETVFYNGELCNVDVFQTIRDRLYPEGI